MERNRATLRNLRRRVASIKDKKPRVAHGGRRVWAGRTWIWPGHGTSPARECRGVPCSHTEARMNIHRCIQINSGNLLINNLA